MLGPTVAPKYQIVNALQAADNKTFGPIFEVIAKETGGAQLLLSNGHKINIESNYAFTNEDLLKLKTLCGPTDNIRALADQVTKIASRYETNPIHAEVHGLKLGTKEELPSNHIYNVMQSQLAARMKESPLSAATIREPIFDNSLSFEPGLTFSQPAAAAIGREFFQQRKSTSEHSRVSNWTKKLKHRVSLGVDKLKGKVEALGAGLLKQPARTLDRMAQHLYRSRKWATVASAIPLIAYPTSVAPQREGMSKLNANTLTHKAERDIIPTAFTPISPAETAVKDLDSLTRLVRSTYNAPGIQDLLIPELRTPDFKAKPQPTPSKNTAPEVPEVKIPAPKAPAIEAKQNTQQPEVAKITPKTVTANDIRNFCLVASQNDYKLAYRLAEKLRPALGVEFKKGKYVFDQVKGRQFEVHPELAAILANPKAPGAAKKLMDFLLPKPALDPAKPRPTAIDAVQTVTVNLTTFGGKYDSETKGETGSVSGESLDKANPEARFYTAWPLSSQEKILGLISVGDIFGSNLLTQTQKNAIANKNLNNYLLKIQHRLPPTPEFPEGEVRVVLAEINDRGPANPDRWDASTAVWRTLGIEHLTQMPNDKDAKATLQIQLVKKDDPEVVLAYQAQKDSYEL